MTRAGQNLTNLTRGMSWAEKAPMWNRLSTQFAKGANEGYIYDHISKKFSLEKTTVTVGNHSYKGYKELGHEGDIQMGMNVDISVVNYEFGLNDINNLSNTSSFWRDEQGGGSDFSNSKLALGTGGLLYGLGETAVTPGSQWLGNNGKYYSKSWGGNQYTGSRAGALNASKAYRIAGRLTFAAGAFISGYEGYNHLRAGNYAGFSKSGLDIGMGAVGFLGPIGLGVSAGYFIIDSTIGWNNAFQSLDRTTQYNQSILGSGWSPFRMEGGLK